MLDERTQANLHDEPGANGSWRFYEDLDAKSIRESIANQEGLTSRRQQRREDLEGYLSNTGEHRVEAV